MLLFYQVEYDKYEKVHRKLGDLEIDFRPFQDDSLRGALDHLASLLDVGGPRALTARCHETGAIVHASLESDDDDEDYIMDSLGRVYTEV